MNNYLFEVVSEYSEACGEQFFIQSDNYQEAEEILAQYFWGDEVKYLGRYSDEEAEIMGLDTY